MDWDALEAEAQPAAGSPRGDDNDTGSGPNSLANSQPGLGGSQPAPPAADPEAAPSSKSSSKSMFLLFLFD